MNIKFIQKALACARAYVLATNTFQKIKVMILYKQVINSQCNEPCTQHGSLYWGFLGFGLK